MGTTVTKKSGKSDKMPKKSEKVADAFLVSLCQEIRKEKMSR